MQSLSVIECDDPFFSNLSNELYGFKDTERWLFSLY
jgi:hypothetical protein